MAADNGDYRRMRGDQTGRIQTVVQEQLVDSGLHKYLKLTHWLIGVILALVGFGFTAALWLGNTYAKADALKELSASHEKIKSSLNDHILNETTRLIRIETQAEDHAKWEERQVGHIAARVGAPRVPAPVHVPAAPPTPHEERTP